MDVLRTYLILFSQTADYYNVEKKFKITKS